MSEFSITRSDDEFSLLALAGDWDIRHVQKLYDGVQDLLALDGPLEIDLEAVTRIDTAVVQLLVSLQQHCDGLGQRGRIQRSSSTAADFLRELGLELQVSSPGAVTQEPTADSFAADRTAVMELTSND